MQHPTVRFLRSRHAGVAAALDRRRDAGRRTRRPDRGDGGVDGRGGRGLRTAVGVARARTASTWSPTTRSPRGLPKHPSRFAGLATVDLDRPMAAVRELRRRVRERRLRRAARGAVAVGPAADRPPLLPAVRRVRRARRAVLHAGRPHRAAAALGDRPAHPVHRRGRARLPRARRSSAGTSAIRGPRRWSRSHASIQNVYIDTSAYTTKRLPAELVRFMRTGTGQRKVLFGTNYPMIGHQHALDGLDELGLTDEARARLPARQRRARLHPDPVTPDAAKARGALWRRGGDVRTRWSSGSTSDCGCHRKLRSLFGQVCPRRQWPCPICS